MTKRKSPRVCILIPAYNEDGVISEVISKTSSVLNDSDYEFDIVVVNDGSTDSTSSKARSSGAIVIDHVLNSGAGGATATGLSYADQGGYDFAATMDADGQHDPLDVLRGINQIIEMKSDLLIGSRLIDSTGMSRVKILGNRGLSFLTYLLFGTDVTDSQSGLRVFSKNALANLRWKTSGYEFCSEMLWRAKQQNMKITEYPIKAIYSEYSVNKGQNNWNAINIIKSLIKRRIVELFE